jgi:hypothetical protein
MELASEVWELDADGARLLYEAGTPEAEAWHAKYGDADNPVDLEPLPERSVTWPSGISWKQSDESNA